MNKMVIVQEQNNTQHQQQIKNINSKIYKNTKNNADLDYKCGKEYLERAKKLIKDGKEKEKQQEFSDNLKLSTKFCIDSAEKFCKANAIIYGEENNKYENNNKNFKVKKNKETVLKTHSFDVIIQAPSNSKLLLKEEAEKLDKYCNPAEGWNSSHTALSYGDIQPELPDVEEIYRINTKVKEKIEKKEKQLEEEQRIEKLINAVDIFLVDVCTKRKN